MGWLLPPFSVSPPLSPLAGSSIDQFRLPLPAEATAPSRAPKSRPTTAGHSPFARLTLGFAPKHGGFLLALAHDLICLAPGFLRFAFRLKLLVTAGLAYGLLNRALDLVLDLRHQALRPRFMPNPPDRSASTMQMMPIRV